MLDRVLPIALGEAPEGIVGAFFVAHGKLQHSGGFARSLRWSNGEHTGYCGRTFDLS